MPFAPLPTDLHLHIVQYLHPHDSYTLQALNRTFAAARLHRYKWVELVNVKFGTDDNDETLADWVSLFTPVEFLKYAAQIFNRFSRREHRYQTKYRPKYTTRYVARTPSEYWLWRHIGSRQEAIEHIVLVISTPTIPHARKCTRVCRYGRTTLFNCYLRRARLANALIDF